MINKLNLQGQGFGRLLVIKELSKREKAGHVIWLCRCDCGNLTENNVSRLRGGHVQSCGCWRKEVAGKLGKAMIGERHPCYKHGAHKIRLYRVWANMKTRCSCSKKHNYRHYGGRGIAVCPEWLNDYPAFKKWALTNGYAENLTIDRINNDGDYEPSNCQWITNSENAKKGHRERRLCQ